MKKGKMRVFAAVLSCACMLSGMVVHAEEGQPPQAEVLEAGGPVAPTEADAAVFVQAMLDLAVKQDPSVAVQLGYLSQDEWVLELTGTIDELRAAYSEMGISQEALDRMIEACMNMLSKTRYVAGETRRLEDGCSFEVTVTYEQLHVFESFWERYAAVIDEWEASLLRSGNISYEDIYSQAIVLVSALIDQSCAEATYGEPATTTFIAVYQDGKFVMDPAQFEGFTKCLYDVEALWDLPMPY